MAFIGKQPTIGNFVKLDAISTSSTNTYNLTLDSVAFSPESPNHCLVSLNGVIQSPSTSFSISGSTITFIPSSGTLSSSDSIDFIMVYGNVLDLGVPSDATVTNAKTNFVSTSSAAGLQIKGDGTTDGTLQLNCSQNSHGIKLKSPAHSAGASYTLTFPTTDGNNEEFLQTNGSGVLTWASAGGNAPSFSAYMNAAQTISTGTHTKLNFNAETYDTAGEFDHSTNYRWSPQTTGKYLVAGYTRLQASDDEVWVQLRKNGSTYITLADTQPTAEWLTGGVRIINHTSSSDYYELWIYQGSGGNLNTGAQIENTEFSAFKLGGV